MEIRDPRCLELDAILRRLSELTRLLPRLTAANAAEERQRLIAGAARGDLVEPSWQPRPRPVQRGVWQTLDRARQLAGGVPAGELYRARLDELELDLAMIEALGDARRVRPLAARRFGTGATPVPTSHGDVPVQRVAEALLESVPDTDERRWLPPSSDDPDEPSLGGFVRAMATAAGLEGRVRVEPRLAAAAAAGERTVLVANRRFGLREARRLAVHEVLGHLVSGANGRAQPLRLLELGTAGSFADQEGLAIFLEEEAGLLDGRRLRTLAARVLATERMHAERRFGETTRELIDEHGFPAEDAVGIAERAYRGGGVARDVGYLCGWLRVRRAMRTGEVSLEELRLGRVGLDDMPALRRCVREGVVRTPVYCPSLARSLRATSSGTSLDAFPPRAVTSLTRFEAT